MERNTIIYSGDILYILRKRKKLIILFMIAGLMIGSVYQGFVYLHGQISKIYKITASAVFLPQNEDGSYASETGKYGRDVYYMSGELSTLIVYVLNSEELLETVIEEANIQNVQPSYLASNLIVSSRPEAMVVELTLNWRDPEEGKRLLASVLTNSTPYFRQYLSTGRLALVDDPASELTVGGVVSFGIIIMAMLGLMTGIFLAIMEYMINPTVINDDFLQNTCKLKKIRTVFNADDGDVSRISRDYAAASFIITEQLEGIENPVIYLTSTKKGEGKTAAALNLARQISSQGKRTLLIDLNVTDPAIKNYTEKMDDTIASPNLDVVPLPDGETITLSKSLMAKLKSISSDYDYTIIDAGAVGDDPDTLMINQIADKAVFVVGFDMASKKDIKKIIDSMNHSGTDIMGYLLAQNKRTGKQSSYFLHKIKTGTGKYTGRLVDTTTEL